MYLSSEAITWAVSVLRTTSHPFIGITFLACKKARLPVGEATSLSLDAVTREHLDSHHRLDPQSRHYFQPFRSNKFWLAEKYPSSGLQAINTQTFSASFIHDKGTNNWGFREDYVMRISEELGPQGRVPLAAIAIWLAKTDAWNDSRSIGSVVRRFLRMYRITDRERRALFVGYGSTADAGISSLFDVAHPDLRSIAYSFAAAPDAPSEATGLLGALRLRNIGPAKRVDVEFGTRLTLIAGDNGLGKSFLLDVAWWAVTGSWAGKPAFPFSEPNKKAAIVCEAHTGRNRRNAGSFGFDWRSHSWVPMDNRPVFGSLCVFARVDGSFAVADKMRATWQAEAGSYTNVLTNHEVWNGKAGATEGLVRDWVTWQLSEDREFFGMLERVLEKLSPDDLGVLAPGRSTRLPGDPRQIPTIEHPYGSVPIVYASAGVQRILLLAYVVIWSWQEHTVAAQQMGEKTTTKLFVVVDEIEAHLHPRWQRTIVPALTQVGKLLSNEVDMQIVVSTHSPMVLASVEADFSDATDVLYHLDLSDDEVELNFVEFHKQGDISSWLTSSVFGLKHARSRDAERAIEAAKTLQISQYPDALSVEKVSKELGRTLAADDPFWPRWTFYAEQVGLQS